jgi:hypothetical protein
VVRAGWLLSAMVVVRDADRLRAVLVDVQAALGLPWRPASVGALDAVLPAAVHGGTTIGPDVVAGAVLARLAAAGHAVRPAPWPPDLLALARDHHERHTPPA